MVICVRLAPGFVTVTAAAISVTIMRAAGWVMVIGEHVPDGGGPPGPGTLLGAGGTRALVDNVICSGGGTGTGFPLQVPKSFWHVFASQ